MIHEGIELKEITEPQIFDPPKEMLVWDFDNHGAVRQYVAAIIPGVSFPVTTVHEGKRGGCFIHCAEIPEELEPKPRRVTNRELLRWLSRGLGEVKRTDGDTAFTNLSYDIRKADEELPAEYVVRKWDDDEWHEPTASYVNLEDE